MRLMITFLVMMMPLFSFAQSVCVNQETGQLREAPSKFAKATWTVGKYMPLKVVGQKGKWLEVRDLDNQKHWIHASSVSSQLRCLVISKNTASIRTGPGRSYASASVSMTDRYTPFRDLGGEDGWLKVEDSEGQSGWISSTDVWKPTSTVSLNLDK